MKGDKNPIRRKRQLSISLIEKAYTQYAEGKGINAYPTIELIKTLKIALNKEFYNFLQMENASIKDNDIVVSASKKFDYDTKHFRNGSEFTRSNRAKFVITIMIED